MIELSVGRGLRSTAAKRIEVGTPEQLCQVLSRHAGKEAWWSPSTWKGDTRGADDEWEASGCIAVDLDWYNDQAEHAPPPEAIAKRIDAMVAGLNCTLAHRTPRGHRVVFLLDAEVGSKKIIENARKAVEHSITMAIQKAGLGGLEIDQEVLFDDKRLLWTPNCDLTKLGEKSARAASIHVIGGDFSGPVLASLAPKPAAKAARAQVLGDAPGSAWVKKGLERSAQELLGIPSGYRNKALNKMAFRFHRFALGGAIDAALVTTTLTSAGLEAGLTKIEVPATVESGRKGALKHGALYPPPPRSPTATPQTSDLSPRKEEAAEGVVAAPAAAGVSFQDLAYSLTVDSLLTEPPRREFLLTDTRTGDGVLVRAKTALLAARGGTGKTMLLVDLAVAHAMGSCWFGGGGWQAARGRSLLLLGEENTKEVDRRFYYAARAAGCLGTEQLAELVLNITTLPLEGHGVSLTTEIDPSTGALPETSRVEELRTMLRAAMREGRPYTFIGLDPMSRFAGADVEKENAAATRFVQVLETLATEECGSPTVMLAHHFRKAGKQDDKDSADAIRGAIALVDGVRWAATVDTLDKFEGLPELLRFNVVKSNYAARPDPLILCRPRGEHGVLRVATPGEISAQQVAAEESKTRKGPTQEEKLHTVSDSIVACLRRASMPGNELFGHIGGRRDLVLAACKHLELTGVIRRMGGPHSPWALVTELAKIVPIVPGYHRELSPNGSGDGTHTPPLGGVGTGTISGSWSNSQNRVPSPPTGERCLVCAVHLSGPWIPTGFCSQHQPPKEESS